MSEVTVRELNRQQIEQANNNSMGGTRGDGWRIADLKIYDEPKKLDSFIHPSTGCCNEGKCTGCKHLEPGDGYNLEDDCNADFDTDSYSPLRRPPQSWCYVEEP